MKSFIVLALFLPALLAMPIDEGSEGIVKISEGPNGVYKLRIDIPSLERNEQRSEDGEVSGNYIYTDEEGNTFDIHYTAGRNGFLATDNNGAYLPRDTPEVEEAKKLFFEQYMKQLQILPITDEFIMENRWNAMNIPQDVLNMILGLIRKS